jgi:hypothetical protein
MSRYTIKDLRQAILGSFVTILFFYAIRAGEKVPPISMEFAIIITIAWFFTLFKSFKKVPNGEHFFQNIFVVYAFNVILSIGFGMATWEEIKVNPFGSIAMITTWMALPVALLFDKHNIDSVLSRYYIRGVGK